jgi:catechol 2,3-dioxygenase-like lactoylglutathione lyase family enzyme
MIRGIKFASVPVHDQEKALAFYTEKLGFRILTDQPFNEKQRWVELGIPGADTRVVLFKFDNSLQPGMQMNFTFWTDDVEGTVRDLKSKGVKITMEPKKAHWGTAAAFQDLDGNTFLLGTK